MLNDIFALLLAGDVKKAQDAFSKLSPIQPAEQSQYLALQAYLLLKLGRFEGTLPAFLTYQKECPGDIEPVVMLIEFAIAAGIPGMISPLCSAFEKQSGKPVQSLISMPEKSSRSRLQNG